MAAPANSPTRSDAAETVEDATGPGRFGRLRRWLPKSVLGRHALLALVGLVVLVLVLEATPPFANSQFATMSYYAIAAAGLTVLTGLNGQISLGHGALMAVGAYTTGLLLTPDGLPLVVVMVIAAVVTALVGVVVGAAASRLHGPYLAGATLAFAIAVPGLAIYFHDFLGGEQGMQITAPRPPAWFSDAVYFLSANETSGVKFLAYVGWVTALLVLLLLANLCSSRVGRVWRAVRDDEVAAELAGIKLGRVRVLAFTVSAACAGLAGAVLGVVVRLAAPSGFTIVLSIGLLTAVVVGGLGSLTGALLGSALLVFLPPAITDVGTSIGLDDVQAAQLAPLVYGAVLVLVMLLAPSGAVGIAKRLVPGFGRGRGLRGRSSRDHHSTRRS
ncbi:MAG: branched-chain amino acid transporter permease [Pseudonocardia sp.]|jgi:branched-chain amino acid transport system permease protein|uniref:branched-chain amino acid ABC transporter permease n=1 Tax=Pseudonocardia sp. TaxID=60912 RepID=UPI00260EE30A|nr:branched-chain amino acid ABC transporter permease [Pseudonocardia sp.]MCU1625766.1 branched-chain amino acid transporter permease [Pseudonocardia sp.]MDT7702059.1 branched-chain amino acid transport system permease protein [Pseudonocardiales bacterium]